MKEEGKETMASENESATETIQNETEIDGSEIEKTEQGTEQSEQDSSSEDDSEDGAMSEKEESLQKKVAELTEEMDRLKDRLLRNQAEFENYKRRTQKEKAADQKYKSERLAKEILPVLDNFERALQTEVTEENKGFIEGMQMVYSQLQTALESEGVKQIETENQEFDPTCHHAVMQIEDDELDSNVVAEELQKGYMLKDKVIRPAMVKVNK